MSRSPSKGQRILDFFFKPVSEGLDEWVCECGTKRKQSCSGYKNLVSHAEKQHLGNLRAFLNDCDETPSTSPVSLFFNTKTEKIHGWLDLVINGLLPFSTVINPVFIRSAKFKSISRPALNKYMSLLTLRVENKISKTLPSKLALVFDGWTPNMAHFVSIYVIFPSSVDCGFDKVLLGSSPFEDEVFMSADAYVKYVTTVLEVYKKSLSNVLCYLGDNCSTNTCFASKVPGKFIGCASHRYNLALKLIFKDCQPTIKKVHTIMNAIGRPIY